MSIANSSGPSLTLAPEIADKLRGVRVWSLVLGVMAVAAASLGVLLAGMVIAMLIDWWTLPENDALRPWLTGVPIVASLGVLVAGIWRVISRRSVLWRAATEVDRTHPQLDQRWTTLARAEGGNHPAMHRKLSDESVAWAPRVAPVQVAPKTRLWHAGWVLVPAFALLLIFTAVDSQRAGVLMSRFLSPTKNLTLTQITGLPEQLVAARGESLELTAQIAGRPVDQAQLEIRRADGKLRVVRLSPEAGVIQHTIREVQESVEVRWLAGDGRSDWLPVAVADRPQIATTRLKITPPTYTKQKVVNLDRLPKRQRLIEGSVIELSFKPVAPVETCNLEVIAGGKTVVEQLLPVDDGWYVWNHEPAETTTLEISLFESHGLAMRKPVKGKLLVYQDRAPSVEVVSPDNEMAVQPDEEIDIEFIAKDDFAITHADLVVYGDNAEGEQTVLRSVPIDLGEQQGAKKVRGSVPLDLSEFALEDGQSISYAVRVYDNREAPRAPVLPQSQTVPPTALAVFDAEPATKPTTDQPEEVTDADTRVEGLAQTGKNAALQEATTDKVEDTPPEPPGDNTVAMSDSGVEAEQSLSTASSTDMKTPPAAENARTTAQASPAKGEPDSPEAKPDSNLTASKATTAADPAKADPPAKGPTNQPSPEEALAKADGESKPDGESPNEPSNVEDGTDRLADREEPSAAKRPATSPTEPKAEGKPIAQDEKASATSDQQRLVAGNEPPPAPEEGPAADPTDPTDKQLAVAPSIGDPDQSRTADSKPSQTQPSSNGKSGKVAVPEGMVAQKQEPTGPAPDNLANTEGGAPQPGNEMTRRLLDTPQQSASSSRMRLKVDEWAGSFDGQRRDKLAIAISPVFAKLDENLAAAEKMTGAVADRIEQGQPWQAEQRRTVARADRLLEDCEDAVTKLSTKTANTPYAFVGLELGTIIHTHMPPAREALWEAKETEVDRAQEVRIAWGEVAQARTRIAELTKSFERIHREHRLAEATDKIKKMYQVFIEDSIALLQPEDGRINNYQRRLAELEMDDEYLKRLKEVLELRRDMQAELARLLTDDPRLMRRYLDRLTARNDTLRDQATLLAERQESITEEAQVWARTDEAKRPALLGAIRAERLSRSARIAELATLHNERLAAWAPLESSLDDPATAPLQDLSKRIASDALKLAAMSPQDEGRLAEGKKLYATLIQLDAAVRRVEVDGEQAKLATHLLNRLAEVRELTLLTSSWIRQTDLLEKGEYWQEAAIEQYKLAMETDTLAGKLAGLEQELTGALPDGSEARDGIASKAKELLETFDTEVSANQLAATFAMRRGRDEPSVAKSNAANVAFQKVERLFDELMRATLDELDKLPVQDPIAQLLRDPTLDELLAQLENESPLQELLGIPARPSNLRIIGDWMRPGNNGGGDGGMVVMQLRQQAEEAKRKAQEAYRRALARAKKGEDNARSKKSKRQVAAKRTEWNTLLSSLQDDLLQSEGRLPPEEYRRAIEYYLARISRLESEPEAE